MLFWKWIRLEREVFSWKCVYSEGLLIGSVLTIVLALSTNQLFRLAFAVYKPSRPLHRRICISVNLTPFIVVSQKHATHTIQSWWRGALCGPPIEWHVFWRAPHFMCFCKFAVQASLWRYCACAHICLPYACMVMSVHMYDSVCLSSRYCKAFNEWSWNHEIRLLYFAL